MTDEWKHFERVYARYKKDLRSSNSSLWELCLAAEAVVGSGRGAAAQISDSIGISRDTLENWAKVGWMIRACDGCYTLDERGSRWTLADIWSVDKLTYDHLLRAARAMKWYELAPEMVLERLLLALDGGQAAHEMERDIEVAEEDERALWMRDVRKLADVIRRRADLFEYRGASPGLIRARNLFLGRLQQEIDEGSR